MYYANSARFYSLLGAIFLLMTWQISAQANNTPGQKRIMGWVEQIHLLPMDLTVNAKLDTGALTSSLHADKISHFKRDGKDWVRFEYHTPHRKKHRGKDGVVDEVFVLERPVVRTTLIKRHQLSSMQRTVITLPIRIGDQTYEPQFTLTSRSNFIYPVLLGRRFLRDTALVDASKTHLQSLQLPAESADQHARAEEKTSEESEDNE